MRAVPINAIELASPQSIAGNMPSASDVAPDGYAIDRATTRQRKTGRPVQFELTELTRQALDDYLRITGLESGVYLFPGRRGPDRSLTTRQHARRVSECVSRIGLDRLKFATHSTKNGPEQSQKTRG